MKNINSKNFLKEKTLQNTSEGKREKVIYDFDHLFPISPEATVGTLVPVVSGGHCDMHSGQALPSRSTGSECPACGSRKGGWLEIGDIGGSGMAVGYGTRKRMQRVVWF